MFEDRSTVDKGVGETDFAVYSAEYSKNCDSGVVLFET